MEGQAHKKRIDKEIELLSSLDPEKYSVITKDYIEALVVYVNTNAECFPELRGDPAIKTVDAEIVLGVQYPFSAPIFMCKTRFCTPSLADGRDLTFELMGKKAWSPITSVVDLVKTFPKFVSTVLKEKNFNCGRFHLGSVFIGDFWKANPNLRMIRCRDISPLGKSFSERKIVLSENVFLLLESKKDQPGQSFLIAWSFLESLTGIRLYSEKYLSLSWLASGETSNIWELSLELLDNPRESFQILLSKVKLLQDVKIYTQKEIADLQQEGGGLKEEDVTLKSIMQMDINEINENIAIYESSISNELTISAVQTLMLLYQKAIEYYSALGNPVHEIYLGKLHDFLQSKDIQAVLNPASPEEPKPEILKIEEEEKIESGEEDAES